MIIDIRVDPDLWRNSILPEGFIEHWLRPDGARVEAGDPIAAIRIEESLHELAAPAHGHLHILQKDNAVIEPGMVIGEILRSVLKRRASSISETAARRSLGPSGCHG